MEEVLSTITVSGVTVQIARKAIKNLHLAVYPPDGRVKMAVPEHVSDENARLAVVSRLAWIKRQQDDFKAQPRQSERLYVSGECHYVFGQSCRLELLERAAKPEVKLLRSGTLRMTVRPGASIETKEKVLVAWYRDELRRMMPELLDRWQGVIGQTASDWGIKKMKTKWGSCNIEQRRVWINLELAKKPPQCLEYILVHELIHLHERRHNERFKALMDQFMPHWRMHQKALNTSPLANEKWEY
jgi:predicted metal-dependent hydrolase